METEINISVFNIHHLFVGQTKLSEGWLVMEFRVSPLAGEIENSNKIGDSQILSKVEMRIYWNIGWQIIFTKHTQNKI